MKLPKTLLLFIVLTTNQALSQFYGSNDPSQQSVTGPGVLWTGASVFASDNTYTTAGTGLSSNLHATDYGFNLSFWDNITGIQLDIERRSNLGADISLIQPWADGELSKINDYNLPTGNNRLMIVFVGVENGAEPVISNVTYAGQAMIKATGFSYATSFWARLECWYLLESSLASIAPGLYDVEVSYNAVVKTRFFDILSAAVFNNVDQNSPFLSFEQKGQNGGGATSQLNTPIAAQLGGMYLTGIFSGNNTSPNSSNGGTNTFQINSGFVEGTDVYREDWTPGNGGIGTGGCLQTAYKIPVASGTENPVFTFNGTPNRRLMIGIGLRKDGVLDTYVQLQKAGVSVGNNYAQTALNWPTVDTYMSYGGPADMWGTTWDYLDVNNAQFGSILQVNVFNGFALVDHNRITIYTSNVLPVELIDFFAKRIDERTVECSWITGSEHNCSHFDIERSFDGFSYEKVGTINGAGVSNSLLTYNLNDVNNFNQKTYYRLKQVDWNGTANYSEIRAVDGSNSFELSIYPNPVANWLTISKCEGCESISIVNSAGQVVDYQEGTTFIQGYSYNLSTQADGVYFVVVNKLNGEQSLQRLMKQSK